MCCFLTRTQVCSVCRNSPRCKLRVRALACRKFYFDKKLKQIMRWMSDTQIRWYYSDRCYEGLQRHSTLHVYLGTASLPLPWECGCLAQVPLVPFRPTRERRERPKSEDSGNTPGDLHRKEGKQLVGREMWKRSRKALERRKDQSSQPELWGGPAGGCLSQGLGSLSRSQCKHGHGPLGPIQVRLTENE